MSMAKTEMSCNSSVASIAQIVPSPPFHILYSTIVEKPLMTEEMICWDGSMISQIPEPTPTPEMVIGIPSLILYAFVLIVCIYYLIRRRRTESTPDSSWLVNEGRIEE